MPEAPGYRERVVAAARECWRGGLTWEEAVAQAGADLVAEAVPFDPRALEEHIRAAWCGLTEWNPPRGKEET
jgi:hypothetical protein